MKGSFSISQAYRSGFRGLPAERRNSKSTLQYVENTVTAQTLHQCLRSAACPRNPVILLHRGIPRTSRGTEGRREQLQNTKNYCSRSLNKAIAFLSLGMIAMSALADPVDIQPVVALCQYSSSALGGVVCRFTESDIVSINTAHTDQGKII